MFSYVPGLQSNVEGYGLSLIKKSIYAIQLFQVFSSPSMLRDYISVGYMLLVLHEGIEERKPFLFCVPSYFLNVTGLYSRIFFVFVSSLHLYLPAILRFLCSRRVFHPCICVFHPCICVFHPCICEDTFVVFPSPSPGP